MTIASGWYRYGMLAGDRRPFHARDAGLDWLRHTSREAQWAGILVEVEGSSSPGIPPKRLSSPTAASTTVCSPTHHKPHRPYHHPSCRTPPYDLTDTPIFKRPYKPQRWYDDRLACQTNPHV